MQIAVVIATPSYEQGGIMEKWVTPEVINLGSMADSETVKPPGSADFKFPCANATWTS
jgi:hypothetical protein